MGKEEGTVGNRGKEEEQRNKPKVGKTEKGGRRYNEEEAHDSEVLEAELLSNVQDRRKMEE